MLLPEFSGPEREQKRSLLKNLICFWVFGLCNNYAYVVMLSAASDIIRKDSDNGSSLNDPIHFGNASGLHCTPVGTGVILLANIIPSLTIKLLAPFFIHHINFHIKVTAVLCFAVTSFLIVATSSSLVISILGVVFASISSGLGETTFLCMSTYFHSHVVSSWSSGTGGAGVIGAVSYAALAKWLGARNTLFVITVIPVSSLLCYMFLLVKPKDEAFTWKLCLTPQLMEETETFLNDSDADSSTDGSYIHSVNRKQRSKLQIIWELFPLMIPLALVYFFEYLINQSLFELIYFPDSSVEMTEQYRWYQVLYQVGVFVSRSSVNLFHFRQIWILAILQGLNVVVFLMQVISPYIGSIWILFALILYEGLLGGMAYVNTFYRIAQESKPTEKEYKIGVATVSDALGITIAGFTAVPVHNILCASFSS